MTIEGMKEQEISVTLTGLEFGALAGAVSTEARRLLDSNGKAAANYFLDVLNDAWLKMLKAWHPDIETEMLKYTDEVTLFGETPFDPESGWSNKPNESVGKTIDPVDSDSDGWVDDKSIAPVIDMFKKSG